MDEVPNRVNWGFLRLDLDRNLLKVGRLGLSQAAGTFPDGTRFRMPELEPLPPPRIVRPEDIGQTLYLARRIAVSSNVTAVGTETPENVALILARHELSAGFVGIPLAEPLQLRSDGMAILNGRFIPSVIRACAAPTLAAFMMELHGSLHQRGEALAGRVAATGRGGAAEIVNFLMLQIINRCEPIISRFSSEGIVHPHDLFQYCVTLASELSTFTRPSKRPIEFPAYVHDRLSESFEPVIKELRQMCSAVLMESAISIPVQKAKFGLSGASVSDRSLLGSAVFVLAARADLPAEKLRQMLPRQLKVGPAEKISDLVNLSLPGIELSAIPSAPLQIPFHAGFEYFELDQSGDLWRDLKSSGGLAIHGRDEALPGLQVELWAIRGDAPAPDNIAPDVPISTPPTTPADGLDEPPAMSMNTNIYDKLGRDPRRGSRSSTLGGSKEPRSTSETVQAPLSRPPPAATSNKTIPTEYDPLARLSLGRGATENTQSINAVPDSSSSSQFPATPRDATVFGRHGTPSNTGRPKPSPSSRIQMTAYGPSHVVRRRPFFIQAVFHKQGDDSKALALARLAEPTAKIAQALPLPPRVEIGETITVRLRGDDRVAIDEGVQGIEWRGETTSAQFAVKLPWLDWRKEFIFTIEVDLAGCPVGRCKFRIDLKRSSTAAEPNRAYGFLSRYERVFLSYASEDAAVVADLAQLIELQGMKYFLDKLSLRAGSEWQPELEKNISSSDLFLLCWSRHAATSEWVAKEIDWALRAQRQSGGARPDIRPFILDGPPIVPPPAALKHLHFNSAARFLKQASAGTVSASP